ncbi:MAG TPA: hypothetical protein ENJ28_00345 [Gammaproteobacteria bacterium]|nr:hypothetical protein [Gammaproteobacteria bacterium]
MVSAKLLLGGSFLRVFTLIANVVIAFLLMPYVIGKLGDEWYGLWVFAGSLITYLSILDVGLSAATQRFYSYHLPQNNHRKLNAVLSTTFFIFLGISFLIAAAAFTVAYVGMALFDSEEIKKAFYFTTLILGLSLAVNLPLYSFYGILTSNFRYDYTSYIQLIKLIIRTSLIVILLENEHGVIYLAGATAITEVIGTVFLLFFTYKIAPWTKVRIRYIEKENIKEYFIFGIFAFLASNIEKTRFNLGNILSGTLLTLTSVTSYNIALKLCEYYFMLVQSILGFSTPMLTQSYAQDDGKETSRKYIFLIKASGIFAVTGAIALIPTVEVLINLWLGAEYPDATMIFYVLIGAFALASVHNPSMSIYISLSKQKGISLVMLIELFTTIVFSIILTPKYGLIGIAFAAGGSWLLTSLFAHPYLIAKYLKISLFAIHKLNMIFILFGSAASYVGLYLVENLFENDIYSMMFIYLAYTPFVFFVLSAIILDNSQKSMIISLVKRRQQV